MSLPSCSSSFRAPAALRHSIYSPRDALRRRRPLFGRPRSPTSAPPTHPLSSANDARDKTTTQLCMEYTTSENAEGNAHALLTFATEVIPTETFDAHTEECLNLTAEEMVAIAPSSPHLFSLFLMTRPRLPDTFVTLLVSSLSRPPLYEAWHSLFKVATLSLYARLRG
jgi:hypothetical protein